LVNKNPNSFKNKKRLKNKGEKINGKT